MGEKRYILPARVKKLGTPARYRADFSPTIAGRCELQRDYCYLNMISLLERQVPHVNIASFVLRLFRYWICGLAQKRIVANNPSPHISSSSKDSYSRQSLNPI
jgi:hypothetical protein